ncbi:hypothetical protein Mapa_011251 [Marchantia paleacea]|nr:hypothetical protein Mapa_011251 [Marchantia paleacea]
MHRPLWLENPLHLRDLANYLRDHRNQELSPSPQQQTVEPSSLFTIRQSTGLVLKSRALE